MADRLDQPTYTRAGVSVDGRSARIIVLDPLDAGALARLGEHHEVIARLRPAGTALLAAVRDADVLVVRSGVVLGREVIEAAGRLRLIARAGVGTDNIDLAAARDAGVVVCNVPGVSANAVAEFAFGLLLTAGRHIALADRQVRAGVWNKAVLAGMELRGKTLGLIGVGAIGSRIAELARAFDMRVLGSVSDAGAERRAAFGGRGVELTGVDDLLVRSDAVSVQVPLTPRTRGLLNATRLARMRSSAFLINVSRAGVVVDDDLFAALLDGTIAGAGLDVLAVEGGTPRFAELDNVVLTPHIGAMSRDGQRRIGELVVDAITAWSRGEDVPNRVC